MTSWQRTGFFVEERTEGYQVELAFGSAEHAAASLACRRSATGTSSATRCSTRSRTRTSASGGTDVEGYIFTLDYALSPTDLLRVRYLSGNEIDGPPFGVDVLQLDFNSSSDGRSVMHHEPIPLALLLIVSRRGSRAGAGRAQVPAAMRS